FLPLICSAGVAIAAHETVQDPAALARTLRTTGATIMQATPTLWQALSGQSGEPLPELQGLRMLVGGEALPGVLARALFQNGAELTNLYGPTETTIWSAAITIDGEEAAHPP